MFGAETNFTANNRPVTFTVYLKKPIKRSPILELPGDIWQLNARRGNLHKKIILAAENQTFKTPVFLFLAFNFFEWFNTCCEW